MHTHLPPGRSSPDGLQRCGLRALLGLLVGRHQRLHAAQRAARQHAAHHLHGSAPGPLLIAQNIMFTAMLLLIHAHSQASKEVWESTTGSSVHLS